MSNIIACLTPINCASAFFSTIFICGITDGAGDGDGDSDGESDGDGDGDSDGESDGESDDIHPGGLNFFLLVPTVPAV